MYLLVVGYRNRAKEYYGPFPTEDRAREYSKVAEIQLSPQRWHIVPLTVPYSVVKHIEWVSS